MEEFRARLLLGSCGCNGTAARVVGSRHNVRYLPLAGEQLYDAMDWRERGDIVEVKDQGHAACFSLALSPLHYFVSSFFLRANLKFLKYVSKCIV